MTSTTIFLQDPMLKRHCRSLSRSVTAKPPASSIESEPLNIILEEDESRSSSPSSCYSVSSSADDSPFMGIKARRRLATVVSDIRLSRVLPVDDFLQDNNDLLSAPRPAPRPPTTPSPLPSPDSFKLTFTDVSFKFPHPPIPTPTSYDRHIECNSPTHSSSSLSSSPGSPTEALTPSTSDDEFASSFASRRPVIQPLVITKNNPRPSSLFDDDGAISPSLLQPFKTPFEKLTESSTPLSPLSPSYLPYWHEEDGDFDSEEPESDSEWYTKEFSKIISFRSPIPPSFPLQTPARPDSMSISSAEILPSKRRVSKPLPPTPLSGGFPSGQLDPTFPRRRGVKRMTIPNYPPPPVPLSIVTPTSSTSSRPPPRSSIPTNCVYDPEDLDDSRSTFSFSIYDVYLGDDGPDRSNSPPSSYSQSSYDDPIDGVAFELDYPMMLPLSLPATPFDLEADIEKGLEQLRNSPVDTQQPTLPAITVTTDSIVQPEEVVVEQQQPQIIDDVFSPFSPTFPSHDSPTINEEKALKSRWSTSTLGSIYEEHERRGGGGASAKLRLYFSGHSPLKNNNNKQSSSRSKKPSISPLSLSPLSRKTPSSSSSPIAAVTPHSPGKASRAHVRGYSDVMVIGYGNNGHGNGMRRRGSLANSVSDAGSEESTSSTSSSGLRRKPIPVEMFLRNAV